jgi:hypothetical protein
MFFLTFADQFDRGKYVNLEDLACKIKPGCTIHPPWPKGICNKCQPNTVYLNRQVSDKAAVNAIAVHIQS